MEKMALCVSMQKILKTLDTLILVQKTSIVSMSQILHLLVLNTVENAVLLWQTITLQRFNFLTDLMCSTQLSAKIVIMSLALRA
jgi:hypothetical protein